MPDQNDLSDLKVTNSDASVGPLQQLPIRGEKRLIPSFVNIGTTSQSLSQPPTATPGVIGVPPNTISGIGAPQGSLTQDNFNITARLKPFVDYVQVRILNRGVTSSGAPDPNSAMTYRFLINPAQVSVGKHTIDY